MVNKLEDNNKSEISESTKEDVTDSLTTDTASQEKFAEIESGIRSFCEIKTDTLNDYADWISMFDKHSIFFEQLESFRSGLSVDEYNSIKDKLLSLNYELMLYYDSLTRKYNLWTAKKGDNLEERADKQQLLNFTVFSLFMTLLTFLLSNIAVTKTDFSTKTIVVVNLTLMLLASIVFLFIGIFFGLIRWKSRRGYICKTIILSLLPLLVGAALVLVSVFMP